MNLERFEKELKQERDRAEYEARYCNGLISGLGYALNILEKEKEATRYEAERCEGSFEVLDPLETARRREEHEREKEQSWADAERDWAKAVPPAPSVVKKCSELVPVLAPPTWNCNYCHGCQRIWTPYVGHHPNISVVHFQGKEYCMSCASKQAWMEGRN